MVAASLRARIVVGDRSLHSLHHEDYVTFGEDSVHDRRDALGVIDRCGLSITVRAPGTGAGQQDEKE